MQDCNLIQERYVMKFSCKLNSYWQNTELFLNLLQTDHVIEIFRPLNGDETAGANYSWCQVVA